LKEIEVLCIKKMKSSFSYADHFSKKYGLKNSFLQGFLYLIGVAENPYRRIADKIARKSIKDAWNEDVAQLHMDYQNAMKKHESELPAIRITIFFLH
jgi:hypothetical protein